MNSLAFKSVADTVEGQPCKWCSDLVEHGELVALFTVNSGTVDTVCHWLCLHGAALDTTIEVMRRARTPDAFAGFRTLRDQYNAAFVQRDLKDICAIRVGREQARGADYRKRASWPLVDDQGAQVWDSFINAATAYATKDIVCYDDDPEHTCPDRDAPNARSLLLPSVLPRTTTHSPRQLNITDSELESKLVPLWAAAELMAALEVAKDERRRASQAGAGWDRPSGSPGGRTFMSSETSSPQNKQSSIVW